MQTQDSLKELDEMHVIPNNNMTMAIIGTVLGIFSPCCIGLILGIIGIVMASQVSSKFNAGDYMGAESSAKNAKTMAYIAIGLGILGIIINIVSIIAMGGIEGYLQSIQEARAQFGM